MDDRLQQRQTGVCVQMARRIALKMRRDIERIQLAVPPRSAAAESAERIAGNVRTLHDLLDAVDRRITAEVDRANTDSLTGLLNREGLHAAAQDKLAGIERVAVLVLDLDHFKQINDRHGHLTGDDVLRAVAGRARRALRDSDLLGRFGGEEFVAVLPGAPESAAVAAAERVRASVGDHPVSTRMGRVNVTVSIGVVSSSGPLVDLIARADMALYEAKADGRNRVRVDAPVTV
jgi:diguanylate cyclase (GGDEF)-like protein